MIDFALAINDPSGHFALPEDVVKNKTLSKEQKIKILQRWEIEARQLQTAEEENMAAASDAGTMLNRVLLALNGLQD